VTDPIVVAKGHGTGNDFVLLVDPEGELLLNPVAVRALCDRRFGIGGDGLLRVVRTERLIDQDEPGGPWDSSAPAWFMDYRNADGSLSEMCGNGIRVFARYLQDCGWIAVGRTRIATRGGVMTVDVPDVGDITVAMGQASSERYPDDIDVAMEQFELSAVGIDVPNPHAVAIVATLADLPVELPAPVVPAEVFPAGANVEFVEVLDSDGSRARMRVHERGVGETLSCGTGACAAAIAVRRATGGKASTVLMEVPGGLLRIDITNDEGVSLTGPAEIVATGELSARWWESISR